MENVNWKQESKTKIGTVIESITASTKGYDAKMIIEGQEYIATGLETIRDAFLWLYGIKQYLNDKVASYKATDEIGYYEKTTKKGSDIYTQKQVTSVALNALHDFALPSQGEGKEKKISVSAAETVLASLGLSEDVLAKARQAMGLPGIAPTTPTTVS